MSNYELKKHKKRDGVKWAITGIAFVLVFAMLAGLFMQLFMPEGKKPSDWFKNTEQEESGAVISAVEENGISLMTAAIMPEEYADYGISALAEQAYTLTASVYPSDSIGWKESDIKWSAEWAKAQSEWAQDKVVSDYVTLSSSYGMSVNVSCVQGFSEQIIIKAELPQYNLSCTANCDYLKKIIFETTYGSGYIELPNYSYGSSEWESVENPKFFLQHYVDFDDVGTLYPLRDKMGNYVEPLEYYENLFLGEYLEFSSTYTLADVPDEDQAGIMAGCAVGKVISFEDSSGQSYSDYDTDGDGADDFTYVTDYVFTLVVEIDFNETLYQAFGGGGWEYGEGGKNIPESVKNNIAASLYEQFGTTSASAFVVPQLREQINNHPIATLTTSYVILNYKKWAIMPSSISTGSDIVFG